MRGVKVWMAAAALLWLLVTPAQASVIPDSVTEALPPEAAAHLEGLDETPDHNWERPCGKRRPARRCCWAWYCCAAWRRASSRRRSSHRCRGSCPWRGLWPSRSLLRGTCGR